MTYHRLPCVEVETSKDVRTAAMKTLIAHMYDFSLDWKRHLAASSLTLVSPCGRRIVKVDSSKVFTMDNRQPDKTWKSVKFTCRSIEEAWDMAAQAVKAFDQKRKRDALH